MALSSGLTAQQVEEVAHWQDSHTFDSCQWALLAYADELVSADSVGDATFAAFAEHFDEPPATEVS